MKKKGLSNRDIADLCSIALCTVNRWVIRLNVRKYLKMDRDSDRYRDWRNKVLGRDGFRCVQCGARNRLQAHHIIPWAVDPKKRFLISNGKTLCEGCHSRIHPWMRQLYYAKAK